MTWTGHHLRDARARRGWTQKQLADQLGAAVRSVASWERDEAKPQAHWVAKLDDLLGDQPQTPIEELDQATIDQALDQASFLDVLGALARKHARATADGHAPDLPAGRWHWRTDDAPSARRSRAQGQAGEQPDESPGRSAL